VEKNIVQPELTLAVQQVNTLKIRWNGEESFWAYGHRGCCSQCENGWIFFFLEHATKDCAVVVFVTGIGIDIAVAASVHDGSRLRPEIIPVRAPFPAPSESCR
jgi:hypothetical protein